MKEVFSLTYKSTTTHQEKAATLRLPFLDPPTQAVGANSRSGSLHAPRDGVAANYPSMRGPVWVARI